MEVWDPTTFTTKGTSCTSENQNPARGHLLGNAMARSDPPELSDRRAGATFSFLNVVPSFQPFDGFTWNHREVAVMQVANVKAREMFYIAGPTTGSHGTLPNTNVAFPDGMWAVMVDPGVKNGDPVMALGWICSEAADIRATGMKPKQHPCVYASVDDVAKKIGFDPVPSLTDKNARANSDHTKWKNGNNNIFPDAGQTRKQGNCLEWW